jgi:Astacin (Peptidase family M12A)/Right handed beta helix region/Periplasmic copper-binding protein (NosD)
MSLSSNRAVLALTTVAALCSGPTQAGFLYNGISPANRPWPGGIVPYVIDPALSAERRQVYLDGIREWSLAGNVQFIPRTSQANYVFLKYDPFGPNRVSGSQPQIVEINSLTRAQICHEMGHSLGLHHEHIRPDRGTYVNVLSANISSGNEFWFDIDPTGVSNGSYDFESVMHFGRDLFSINPGVLDTLQAKPGYERYQVRMGNFALSPGDRSAIAWLYGAVALSSVVTNTADTGPGSLRAALYYATDHPGTTVTFNIPTSDPGYGSGVFTIHSTGHLPPLVTNGTKVDATTQPGYAGSPLIFVDGSKILTESGEPPGLMIYAANCMVKGLAFTRARWVGVAVLYPDAVGNTVCSCWSGVAPGGNTALPNVKQGIEISGGASGNTIGPDNVISGGPEYGIWISGSTTTANVVTGNRIGTNATGTAALANGFGGVIVTGGAHDNIIGGGNVLSGNTNAGLWLTGTGVEDNQVTGNFIGLNAAGTSALPNSFAGMYVTAGAKDNLIIGNVLSGNPSEGIRIADAGSKGNRVEGNWIGTNAAGTAAVPNGFAGATMYNGASGNTIIGNVVSGNSNYGIVAGDPGSNGNLLESNLVGMLRSGAALANGFAGIMFSSSSQGNTVKGNLIRNNGSYGIALFDPVTTYGHQFTMNSISGNGFMGISIDGANHGQAKPVLTSAVAGANNLYLTGSLAGSPGSIHRIEFFGNPAPGDGSGKTYLGAVDGFTIGVGGSAAIDATINATIATGRTVTAIATRTSTGDSSEFSLPVTVTATDPDQDGMPSAYETANGLNPALNDAGNDNDQDGFSNLDEYLAGTDPQDANDVPRAESISLAGNTATVVFRTVAGKFYQIEESTTLAAGAWRIVVPLQQATGPTTSVNLPRSGTKKFYRARLAD